MDYGQNNRDVQGSPWQVPDSVKELFPDLAQQADSGRAALRGLESEGFAELVRHLESLGGLGVPLSDLSIQRSRLYLTTRRYGDQ